MARSIFSVFAYAIALLLDALPAQAEEVLPEAAAAQKVATMQSCTATALADRGLCKKSAVPGPPERNGPCEDVINRQQRTCMIEVLEALSPSAPRTAIQPR